jgi:hypothetical protein
VDFNIEEMNVLAEFCTARLNNRSEGLAIWVSRE